MSLRNFQRRFKIEFKRSAHEWLNDRRAERIFRDIRGTDKELAEIAVDYGFATSSYFTTFCKQYFGKTPSALRRQSDDEIPKGPRAVVSEIPEGGGIFGSLALPENHGRNRKKNNVPGDLSDRE